MNKKINPNRVVTTAFGKSAKRNECRCIREKFYIMNEECFKFDGRWYRINSGFLVEDIAEGKWVLKDAEDIVCGLIESQEGKVKTGYFTKNVYKNVSVDVDSIPSSLTKDVHVSGGTAYAYNLSVTKKLGLIEDIPSGIFMTKEKASKRISIGGTYGFTVDYLYESSGGSIKEAFKRYLTLISGKALNHKLLGNLSFGWEFETTDGYVHPRHLVKTGLIPLRDGSISGYEFATCPLKGQKGIDTTIRAAEVLSKFTTTNISCSLHLHIGNVPVTEKYLVDFFKVCTAIQGDIFRIFPASMEHTAKYKGRDYCSRMPKISKTFKDITAEKIINWASGRDGFYRNSFKGLGTANHPDDQSNNRKWGVEQRYRFINVIPMIFSKRGTVEFRIHTPTTNPVKLVNWLYICGAIATFADKFVDNYTDESLQKMTLRRIISIVYSREPDIAEYLISYIDWREKFMKQCDSSGDDIGSTEIIGDLDFKFPYKGYKTLAGNG